jgi:hypothetical protein
VPADTAALPPDSHGVARTLANEGELSRGPNNARDFDIPGPGWPTAGENMSSSSSPNSNGNSSSSSWRTARGGGEIFSVEPAHGAPLLRHY